MHRVVDPKPELHVLRVFCAADGSHGNALGVFIDGRAVPADARQGVARELGYSETVFVDDAAAGVVRIFTPAVELPFAGHPMVGAAWLLAREGWSVNALRPPAGTLTVRTERAANADELTYIGARPEWSPPFEYVQLGSEAEVDALREAPGGLGWAYCWAWADESSGRVRARSFVAEVGIAEDEATGSAALALCARLGREIRVRQGRGSELHARPVGNGFVEVGGRVVFDEARRYALRPALDQPSG
jgi:predicted PhzF superfamily epimerase YddE/YHI9